MYMCVIYVYICICVCMCVCVCVSVYIYIYIYIYIAEGEKAVCLSTEAALESRLQLRAEKAAVLQATQVNAHAN